MFYTTYAVLSYKYTLAKNNEVCETYWMDGQSNCYDNDNDGRIYEYQT